MSPETSVDSFIRRHCIALTGGIATGKTTVASLLRQRGYAVLDADQLSRAATVPGTPGLQEVVAKFGHGVLTPQGELDRPSLRKLVFADRTRLRDLEAILHPHIRTLFRRSAAEIVLPAPPKPDVFFYEAALIIETQRTKDFRALWATLCSRDEQVRRLMQRNQLDRSAATTMVDAQMPAAEKATFADAVLDTSGTPGDLAARVDQLLAQIPRC